MKPLNQAELAAVMAPVAKARGLPNAFYTDPELFEVEKNAVFEKNWSCIGFGKDIPENGDARPVSFFGIPLMTVRDRQGQVRVFQNVCRHRGMKLVNAPTRFKGVIRCPYHSWCYELDGGLRSTPHVGGVGHNTHPDIDREVLGLFEVRSKVWMDVIFVNISGDAPEFEDYAASLIARWSEFDGKPIFHGGPNSTLTFQVKCNWKLAVENFCESYHLPWVHPGLNSYSKLEDHYNILETNAYAGQGTRVYNPQLDETGRRFSDFAGLSSKWDAAAEYIGLFPNVQLGVHRDHFFVIHLEPVDVETTREYIEIYYASEDMCGEAMADLRNAHAAAWNEVFSEDVFVIEGMQNGRNAPAFDGGKFAPVMDEATHCFHHWVAGHFAQP